MSNKQKQINLLIKWGHNPEDVFKMVEVNHSYVEKTYATATNSEKCDVIASLWAMKD